MRGRLVGWVVGDRGVVSHLGDELQRDSLGDLLRELRSPEFELVRSSGLATTSTRSSTNARIMMSGALARLPISAEMKTPVDDDPDHPTSRSRRAG